MKSRDTSFSFEADFNKRFYDVGSSESFDLGERDGKRMNSLRFQVEKLQSENKHLKKVLLLSVFKSKQDLMELMEDIW
jgi:hypothetical protein